MTIPFAVTIDTENDYWGDDWSAGIVEGIPLILDLLKRLDAKGTFFWTGETAQKHPEIIARVIAEGHEIACHGLHHENFGVLKKEEQQRIIKKASGILRGFGCECVGFRAPRLRVNETLYQILAENGYHYDSSIPHFGLRRYKYGRHYDDARATAGIPVLKCTPCYALRLSEKLFRRVVRESHKNLGHCVFFLHPWEVIARPNEAPALSLGRRMNIINTLGTGPAFLLQLEQFFTKNRDAFSFATCKELADSPQKGSSDVS